MKYPPENNKNGQLKKILTLDNLAVVLESHRREGKKIALCHGVFDLLHIGHIRHFEHASRKGDILVVTITPDRYVSKGPHRPAFPEDLRAEAIASLKNVDYVAINNWPTAIETLQLLRPDYYVKGAEYQNADDDLTGNITHEEQAAQAVGATLYFTEDIIFSSSNLINRYISNLPNEINEYLNLFRQRHKLDDIMKLIDNMADLNVLVIGDTIIDEYQYCDAIGKSSKDPTLALKYKSHDLFAGGVLAVANHIASFANSVKLVTIIGDTDSREDFIRSQLHPNISPHFEIQPNAPTIVKRRFVDGYSFNKLLEIYVMDDSGLPDEQNTRLCDLLEKISPKYDLIVAADFGHGAINAKMVKTLSGLSSFLAVNTQANAGNRGFNTISRYPRADYACIAEHELRLETRDQSGKIRPWMKDIIRKIGCQKFTVTRGRKGCAIIDQASDFVKVPSFAYNIVDRVGAGDAFFAITSMAAAQNTGNEIIGFLGNVVGALAVETIGNKKSIDKTSVQKSITAFMK